MSERQTATVVIHFQNHFLGEDSLSEQLVSTLRKYCDIVDRREAGHEQQEVLTWPNGSRLAVMAVTSREIHVQQEILNK